MVLLMRSLLMNPLFLHYHHMPVSTQERTQKRHQMRSALVAGCFSFTCPLTASPFSLYGALLCVDAPGS